MNKPKIVRAKSQEEKRQENKEQAILWGTIVQAGAAVAGVFLGCVGIWLSYTVYWTTVRSEEFKIRPALVFVHDVGERTFALRNVGLGPAVVRGVQAKIADKLYDIPKVIDSAHLGELQDTVIALITKSKENASVLASAYKTGVKVQLNDVVQLPQAGTVISQADDFRIYYSRKLDLPPADDPEKFQEWTASFGQFPSDFDLRVCYCSLSGETCFVVGLNQQSEPSKCVTN